ncbi:MAG: aminopeptidase P family N-terminal domain-containing protein, partial [Acidobacterium ailaaui]|nr:aminopeptidase P family N-terminal domain-containing protein [Pseudacidobacterium ailaaui]
MTGQMQQTLSPTQSFLVSLCSEAQLHNEKNEKLSRLMEWMDSRQLDAILLRRNENIAWVSCGQVETTVAIPAESGVASLLLLRDGRKFYLTTNNEAGRLADEEFTGLDYEPIITPWYENTINE